TWEFRGENNSPSSFLILFFVPVVILGREFLLYLDENVPHDLLSQAECRRHPVQVVVLLAQEIVESLSPVPPPEGAARPGGLGHRQVSKVKQDRPLLLHQPEFPLQVRDYLAQRPNPCGLVRRPKHVVHPGNQGGTLRVLRDPGTRPERKDSCPE